MTRKLPPNAPTWTAVGLVALGLIMIFLGWNGAAGPDAAVDLRAQFPYLISGGLFGLALIAAGLVLVRVQEGRKDTREVLQQLQLLTQAVERLGEAATTPGDPMVPTPLPVYGGPGGPRPTVPLFERAR